MADSDDAYKRALDSVQKMLNAQKDLNKQAKSFESMWTSIASQVFALDGAEFFREVQKSPEDLRKIRDEIGQMKEQFDTLGTAFGQALDKNKEAKQLQNSIQDAFIHAQKSAKSFSLEYNNNLKEQFDLIKSQGGELSKIITSQSKLRDVLSGKLKLDKKQMEQLQKTEVFLKLQDSYHKKEEVFQKTVEKIWDKRIKTNQKLANFNKEAYQSITEQLAAGKSYEEIAKTATGDAKMLLAELAGGNEEIFEMASAMEGLTAHAEKLQKSAGEVTKQFRPLSGIFNSLAKKFKSDLLGSITEFDDVLHNVQRESGIVMDTFANSKAFGDLTTYSSQFGVSVEQAGKMMTDMSKQLNTTNFGVLSQAAKDFAAIEGATGAASEDITNIAGEMMRMGASSSMVRDSMEEADQMARQFGVSSNKVINGISRNIKKMREMGFTGGEKSLAKMAVQAERLRMNMDETFDTAKRARTIEGAMNMAAELQLAGGSFANIKPMDLLAAARKGPEELQKILTKMGQDIGHFDKTTGEFKFDPVDVDRLQMVSDATGQSMESLQNMIQKNAEDTEKLNPFSSLIDSMDEADKEMAKSTLSDMLKVGKDGKIELDASSDMAKNMGIDSMEELQQLNSIDLKKRMEDNKKTLEQENVRNQSLKKSFDNFMKAVMSLGTVLEPLLQFLTGFITGITSIFVKLSTWGNGWGKYILAGLITFGVLFSTNVGLLVGKFLMGFANTAKNMIGAITNPKQALGGLMDKLKGGKGTMEVPGKEISEQKGMTKGAGEGIKGFFTGLAEGIRAFGKIKMGDLLKFAASLAIIGGAIIGFSYALAAVGGEASIGQWINAMGALVVLGGITLINLFM